MASTKTIELLFAIFLSTLSICCSHNKIVIIYSDNSIEVFAENRVGFINYVHQIITKNVFDTKQYKQSCSISDVIAIGKEVVSGHDIISTGASVMVVNCIKGDFKYGTTIPIEIRYPRQVKFAADWNIFFLQKTKDPKYMKVIETIPIIWTKIETR